MAENLFNAMEKFRSKFKKFSQSDKQNRVQNKSENSILQEQINERTKRFEETVILTYKIYKSPLEELGLQSERAKSLEKDESALFKAYSLFKGVIELNGKPEEIGATFISKVNLVSPLTQKATYTQGGQFIYLWLWLFFEKKCQDFVPVFIEKEGTFELSFVPFEEYSFSVHDKEIFAVVKQKFYSL